MRVSVSVAIRYQLRVSISRKVPVESVSIGSKVPVESVSISSKVPVESVSISSKGANWSHFVTISYEGANATCMPVAFKGANSK